MNLNEVDKPEVKKTVVVYSGRFQPFHKGHYLSYLKLCSKFGKNNVYIGTSNDTSGPKSPFNFNEKVKIMNTMFGIPSNKIVQVKNPYAPKEILSPFDGKTTQYIAAVGEKDASRLKGKYFKPYNDKAGYGYEEIGYVYAVPSEKNPISGTDVRSWLGGDNKDKEKNFLKAYPKFDKEIYKMITGKLNEEGLPGGIGVGLNLPGGYINGAPTGSTNESNNTNPSTEFRKEPHPTRHQTEHPSDEPDWYDIENPYDPISEIIGRVTAEEIFEEFVKTYFKEESEAEKQGLVHLGGGYYAKDKGQPATHKSDKGKLRTLTPAEVDAEKQKQMAKGPSDAPVNEPKPSQPGQPVNKDATAQGKVNKKKEEPNADTKGGAAGGEQGPPPEQKLSGAELKSNAEKRADGEGSEQNEKAKKVKADLDKSISELEPNDQKEVESHNNPDSPERKAMAEQAESGWEKFKKNTMFGRFLAKKQKQYSDTGDAIKTLASGKRLGTIKDSEGKDVHWKDLQKKDENGEPMFDKKPVYEKNKMVYLKNDGTHEDDMGNKVDKDGYSLDKDGKRIQATNLLGKPKYDTKPIYKDDLTDEQKQLAHESHHKSHEQTHALVHTGIEAGFLIAGVAMAGGIAAGASVVGKTIIKDVAKHAALETIGVNNPVVAGSTGLLAAHITHHVLEEVYLKENSKEVNTQKLFENIVTTTLEKFKTYKLSDEQLLKVIEKYKKDKPKEDLQNLLKEDISDSKKQNIQHFVEYATKRLKLKETPNVTLVGGKEYGNIKSSLGGYNPDDKSIYVSTEGRLTADILRTVAHEMVHRKQDEMGYIKDSIQDGSDGSPIENQAHSIAGILMREYGRINKQIYQEAHTAYNHIPVSKADKDFTNNHKSDIGIEADDDTIDFDGKGGYEKVEDITMDVDKGDTVLMGKFKNKKTTVKDIGTDDHGMPTINGKKAATFRIPRGEEKSNPQSVFNEKISAHTYDSGTEGEEDFTKHHATSMYAPDMGHGAEPDTYDFDDLKDTKPGYQTPSQDKDVEDRGYEPVKSLKEVGPNDWHFKAIMKMWDTANSFTKKKIGAVVCNDPKADKNDVARTLRNYGYKEVTHVTDKLGLDEKKNLNELTQGLFAGKIKIGGQPVEIEVELLGADNKTKEFITKVIHIDKKYQSKLPIGSTFKIPARIFRMPGGGWHKIKSSAFKESLNELTNNEKQIKNGNPNNVFYAFYKGQFDAVYWAMNPNDLFNIYWDKFKVRRPAGSKFKLNSEFIIVPKKEYDNSTSNRYAKLKPYVDKFWDKLKNESINESLLVEGGAYGHMSHPFDDMDLTFGDLKNIIKGALTGNLELTREKTDGQALAISWKNGRLIAARNKSHLQNAGMGAMGIEDVASKFGGRGGLTDAYNFAMRDLTAAISGLSEAQRKKIFNEGQCFMNLEVIWPTSVNVIPYGQALLVFHNTTCYDEKGSAIGANQGAATMLAGMIKQVNADVQSKYTIQGPPVTELPKNEELSSKQTKYLTQLQRIQFQFQLSDKDGVSEYHQAWWEDFVNKSKVKLQKLEKEALVRRWAFGDKSFRLNTIADKDAQKWAMDNDKVNVAKQQKDNVRQFEEIFLGVGADVLSFMGSVLTVNPDAAVRNMKDRLKSTADKVRGSGDVSKIAKLKMELSRLASIGGVNKIVPNEGIVFVYKGNTYKLTGTFAPLNQILGIFYE